VKALGKTIIEKIIGKHFGKEVKPGDIVDVFVGVRAARDFGGANVVKHIKENGLKIADPSRTYFTFDCNPGGSDQKYAANQQICRQFAREHGIKIYDIDQGIGTHIAMDEKLVKPGEIFVSTDSHANIMGAISAFGQGMGDLDIAAVFSEGRIWFKVPESVKIVLKGMPGPLATPKDVTLALCRKLGANGLLGYSAEIYGDYVKTLNLSGKVTISSMGTEMGAIIIIFPPEESLMKDFGVTRIDLDAITTDHDAKYAKTIEIDIEGLVPLISKPGNPEDVTEVENVAKTKVDSVFIGSCTNGRYEDMKTAADILDGKKVAPGVVLKIVPGTRKVWERCLREGIIKKFIDAGALVGNPGCAGCAEGQIGQNGPGEITVSTGNRNFKGKQGKGSVYLASPATAAASAIAGYITTVDKIPEKPALFISKEKAIETSAKSTKIEEPKAVSNVMKGKAWVIAKDNIDTDMIYHNRYLPITDVNQMGQYTFDNLEGYNDFAKKAKQGDIVIAGKNFGCGSSRQHAVDCFKSLGIQLILAESFGAIYERNAINAALPIMNIPHLQGEIATGDEIEVDISTGVVKNLTNGKSIMGTPMSAIQRKIFEKGGLLKLGE